MQEIKQEELERMFPNGYVITYIQPNNEPAYQWFNPKRDDFIDSFLELLNGLFYEEDV